MNDEPGKSEIDKQIEYKKHLTARDIGELPQPVDDQEPDHDTICVWTKEMTARVNELMKAPDAFIARVTQLFQDAARAAVEENDRLGIDMHGTRNGRLAVRKPGGKWYYADEPDKIYEPDDR